MKLGLLFLGIIKACMVVLAWVGTHPTTQTGHAIEYLPDVGGDAGGKPDKAQGFRNEDHKGGGGRGGWMKGANWV
jgi:hypothetical protein